MAHQNNTETAQASGKQADNLRVVFNEIAKLAIITLDTQPVGVDRAKAIPVGKFVRLNDVRAVLQRFINDSLAVR